MKGKVDKTDVDKLVPVHVDLSRLSYVVNNDVVKKDVHKISDIINLATITVLNAKANEVKKKTT